MPAPPKAKLTPEQLVKRMAEQHETLLRTGTEWLARQAIGDAVLLVLRDGQEPERQRLSEKLRDMAEGRVTEWLGQRGAAEQAIAFIANPPDHLPEFRTK